MSEQQPVTSYSNANTSAGSGTSSAFSEKNASARPLAPSTTQLMRAWVVCSPAPVYEALPLPIWPPQATAMQRRKRSHQRQTAPNSIPGFHIRNTFPRARMSRYSKGSRRIVPVHCFDCRFGTLLLWNENRARRKPLQHLLCPTESARRKHARAESDKKERSIAVQPAQSCIQ